MGGENRGGQYQRLPVKNGGGCWSFLMVVSVTCQSYGLGKLVKIIGRGIAYVRVLKGLQPGGTSVLWCLFLEFLYRIIVHGRGVLQNTGDLL